MEEALMLLMVTMLRVWVRRRLGVGESGWARGMRMR